MPVHLPIKEIVRNTAVLLEIPEESAKPPSINAPTLTELKTRVCSPEELQAALVKIIELHNQMEANINQMIQDGRIRSGREAA